MAITLLQNLYYTVIQTWLLYGSVCWGITHGYLIHKLRVAQNHYIRNRNIRRSSFPLFNILGILLIQHLYVYKVELRLIYTRSGNQWTNGLYCQTRNMFRVPKVNKAIFRQSYIYNGPKLFNQISNNLNNDAASRISAQY